MSQEDNTQVDPESWMQLSAREKDEYRSQMSDMDKGITYGWEEAADLWRNSPGMFSEPANPSKPQQIEATSKKIKKEMAIGIAILTVGGGLLFYTVMDIMANDSGFGLLGILSATAVVMGFAIYFSARTKAWWHHS
ncbi:MAG: hypothetical protein JJT75_15060 [Opitutales bacterium]|nr:hypothetical protein [Opitutales bacterium]